MTIKRLIEEDLTNYKMPSMLIGTARCSFKCDAPNHKWCQNRPLVQMPDENKNDYDVVNLYLKNNLTQALIFAGLEPMDQFDEMIEVIKVFRQHTNDDIVIYTGYNKDEIQDKVDYLKNNYVNIVIKFGRYIPNQKPHYDSVLGVELASDNQFAERVS